MKFIKKIFSMMSFIGISAFSYSQGIQFTRDFAPAEAFVKPQERPCRDDVCLNGTWKFMPVTGIEKQTKDQIQHPEIPAIPRWEPVPLKVPSPWNVNSFAKGNGGDFVSYPSYPKSWETVHAAWLMRKIPYRREWKDKRLILRFEAIAGYSQIFVNKKKVGENFDLFLPLEIDITDQIRPDGDNELLVWVADAELFNQPGKYGKRTHVGGSFWGEHAIGIWQDVYLIAKPAVNIQSIFIKPNYDQDELEVEVTISNQSPKAQSLDLSGSIMPWINKTGTSPQEAPETKWDLGTEVLRLSSTKVRVNPNSTQTFTFRQKVAGRLKPWSAEDPNLYGLVLSLRNKRHVIDKLYQRFGWRQFAIKGDKFFLNGNPLVLKADSWHFMGVPQMTRRYAWAWYKMLKDSHGNALRLHAQPYPKFYLDLADEMGVYILDETGIWASDAGPKADSEEYWKNAQDHLERLILRDRNHASVFGWSVCNENLPVVMHVQRAPESLVKRQIAEINKWVATCRTLDPTRSWISGDGETPAATDLPTVIGHYGQENEIKQWSSQGKVWGIGEQGMGYAGTPREAAKFNGERAYESMQGRMEGVAAEAAQLLNLQKKYKASINSIFNVVWYGLKPLELGLKDTTRAPGAADGVFFPPFREDKPGMQPERLGPYTTTLNPGYDPGLPLYKPWPLFHVVKASFVDTGFAQPLITQRNETNIESKLAENHSFSSVILLSSDPEAALYRHLKNLGVDLKTTLSKNGKDLVLIDGAFPPSDAKSFSIRNAVLQKGGTVFIWGLKAESLVKINKYLPDALSLTSRKATSLISKGKTSLLKDIENSDLYFTELVDEPVMQYGLSGEAVSKGKVLMEASNIDWSVWNNRPEYLKTAAVIRNERETKPEGAALLEMNAGKGKIYIFSPDPQLLIKNTPSFVRLLFSNLGVSFKNSGSGDIPALSSSGVLQNALVLGSFEIPGKGFPEIAQVNFLNNSRPEDFFAGSRDGSHFWEIGKAEDGVFNFKKMGLSGPVDNAVAYISFWVYSPRSLVDLLVAPDMPRLDMYVGADDAFQVYINNKLISESIREGGLKKRANLIKALPLERGWSHFLIKVIQKGGNWSLSVEFDSDKKGFLKEVKSKISQ